VRDWTLVHNSSVWSQGETFQIDRNLGQELLCWALVLRCIQMMQDQHNHWPGLCRTSAETDWAYAVARG
jgi:hypothetical protein